MQKGYTMYTFLYRHMYKIHTWILCSGNLGNLYISFRFLLIETIFWIIAYHENNRLNIVITNKFVIILLYIYKYHKKNNKTIDQ